MCIFFNYLSSLHDNRDHAHVRPLQFLDDKHTNDYYYEMNYHVHHLELKLVQQKIQRSINEIKIVKLNIYILYLFLYIFTCDNMLIF